MSGYLDFNLTQSQGDGYLNSQGIFLPYPVDLEIQPPHQVGVDLNGSPVYQGTYTVVAHFLNKTWSQMQAIYAYYQVGLNANDPQVTVGFYDPFAGAYVTKTGWMHEPQLKAQARLYQGVTVRFSHLV